MKRWAMVEHAIGYSKEKARSEGLKAQNKVLMDIGVVGKISIRNRRISSISYVWELSFFGGKVLMYVRESVVAHKIYRCFLQDKGQTILSSSGASPCSALRKMISMINDRAKMYREFDSLAKKEIFG